MHPPLPGQTSLSTAPSEPWPLSVECLEPFSQQLCAGSRCWKRSSAWQLGTRTPCRCAALMAAVFISALRSRSGVLHQLETFMRTEGNYTASMRVITVEPGGTTSEAMRNTKLRLLLVRALNTGLLPELICWLNLAHAQNFGEHGRELVTVEVALRLLAALAAPRAALERSAARGQPTQRLGHLLRQCVFKARLVSGCLDLEDVSACLLLPGPQQRLRACSPSYV